MVHQPLVLVDIIETILIGANPRTAFLVDKHTHDTGITDHITPPETRSHITEATRLDRLAVDTLLQQAEPQVTLTVFGDGIHLTDGEINLETEIRIIYNCARLGIIESHTLAVVAYQNVVRMVAEQGGNRSAASACNRHETVALLLQHTGIRRTHVDMAILILSQLRHHQFGAILQIAAQLPAVVTEQTIFLGDEPQLAFMVFEHRYDGMQIG